MFDSKRFVAASLKPRTEDVPVSALASFFEEGADPVFKVRGLTGHEVGQTKDEAKRNRDVAAYLEGLLAAQPAEKTEAVKGLLGLDGKATNDIAERLAILRMGVVSPVIDFEVAGKLCECFPVVFYDLTNRILVLTGAGHSPGEPTASGEMTA